MSKSQSQHLVGAIDSRSSICLPSSDLSAVSPLKVLSRALVIAEKRTPEMVQLDDKLKEEKTSSGCRAVVRLFGNRPAHDSLNFQRNSIAV